MSADLRAALARLTAGERAALISRWTDNARHWSDASSALGAVWTVLAGLVAEVDRMDRARAAGLAQAGPEPHTMRPARQARR